MVAVHRLREVSCLYGFTRFEAAPTSADGELEDVQLAVRGAPISRDADWLPAIEQFGEGIFIQFDEAAIGRWLASAATRSRHDLLDRGYLQWIKRFADSAEVSRDSLRSSTQPVSRADDGNRTRLRLSRQLAQGTNLCPVRRDRRRPRPVRNFDLYSDRRSSGHVGRSRRNGTRIAHILRNALERATICSNDSRVRRSRARRPQWRSCDARCGMSRLPAHRGDSVAKCGICFLIAICWFTTMATDGARIF